MDVPYAEIFVGLLAAYMVFSVWAHLDGRYPIGAALVLLVATAVVDATGDVSAANSLAEFVFFLLAGGVVLLLVEHVRDRAPGATPPSSEAPPSKGVPTETADERKRTADQTLDGLEEQPVALIDGPGRHDQDHKEGGDSESDAGKLQGGELPTEGERRVQDREGEPDGERGGEQREHEVAVERVDPAAGG